MGKTTSQVLSHQPVKHLTFFLNIICNIHRSCQNSVKHLSMILPSFEQQFESLFSLQVSLWPCPTFRTLYLQLLGLCKAQDLPEAPAGSNPPSHGEQFSVTYSSCEGSQTARRAITSPRNSATMPFSSISHYPLRYGHTLVLP